MPEDKTKPLIEIWVTDRNNVNFRVYRGRNPRHIAWKLQHHKLESPTTKVIDEGHHDVGPGPELEPV